MSRHDVGPSDEMFVVSCCIGGGSCALLFIHAVMANFETIAQRVLEEHCVERWVMLVEVLGTFDILAPMRPNDARYFVNKGSAWGGEGNPRSRRVGVGIGKNIEEIRPDAAVTPSIAVTHDSRRRRFSSEERHEGIVERADGIRIANPQIDVTE
jgi:hypothetical protein